MAWAPLESIGTMVSLFAVVISVTGLAFRTRQNTQSLRTLTYSRSLDRLASIQSRLSGDADMARLFAVGMRKPDELSAGDRIRMTWVLYEMFGAFEFMFDQAHEKALPADVWKRWAATVSWWLSLPGVRAWWRAKPAPFNPRFSAFVDDRLARPVLDADADARWQAFLRSDARADHEDPVPPTPSAGQA